MSLEENNYSRLEELSGSDFEIVDNEPNIIGWDVKNEAGVKIGEVDNLLFDPESRNVRYLVVDLDTDYLGLDTDKKVLIPIGVVDLYGEDVQNDDPDVRGEESVTESYTESNEAIEERPYDTQAEVDLEKNETDDEDDNLDTEENVVILSNVLPSQLLELPDYEQGKLTPVAETLIRNILEGEKSDFVEGSDFYEHDHFNEDRPYGKVNAVRVIDEVPSAGLHDIQGDVNNNTLTERPLGFTDKSAIRNSDDENTEANTGKITPEDDEPKSSNNNKPADQW